MSETPSILFLHCGSVCYDSVSCFEQAICNEFAQLGWQTESLSCPKENALPALKALYGKRYSIIFDINSTLPGQSEEDGTFCLDRISGQVWHYILDHPFYHHDILKCPLKDFHVICLDETHAAFIRNYYPHIKQVLCLPLAGIAAKHLIPYPEREHSVLFTGTYTDPDIFLYQTLKQPPEKKALFEKTVQFLLDKPESTLEEALAHFTSNKDLPCTLQQNYFIDMYLRASLREELLVQFLRKKIPVTLYGHNWESFLKKCQKTIPNAQNYLFIKGEISYEKLPELYTNTKIILNQLPWFKAGMHDRIPLALMNGCVCLTDESSYLEQHFLADEELYFYSLENMENAAEIAKELLKNPGAAAKTAARGYSCAVKRLSWKHWVKTFLQCTQCFS